MSTSGSFEEAILVLAPLAHDARAACRVLEEAGMRAKACGDMTQVCHEMARGCGAIVVAEEALTPGASSALKNSLDAQEPWSDLPVLILTGPSAARAADQFGEIGNVVFLERPFSRTTLLSSVKTGLRARRKQFEVRRLLEALHASKEDAVHASTAKGQFLANMSHEIRTPIGAIMGFVDLMSGAENTREENSHYREIIDRNSRHLLRLIDDILDLSKVEAGKLSIEHLKFNLPDILADISSVMRFKAEEKGVAFDVKFDTKVPEYVMSDSGRLRQILTNVIGNAIKFTERGSVTMRVGYEKSKLVILVQDTGVGLSREQMDRLFKPFQQADSSTTRKFGGTGLGLILSRRLAEALGGSLDIEKSEKGVGSVFRIEIVTEPARDATFVEAEAFAAQVTTFVGSGSSERTLEGLRVLLVEDSLDNQILISTYLRKTGAVISTAVDGADGIRLAMSEQFDVVLMDIQMPVLDGHEATRKLRGLRFDRPIVALTAHAMKEERLRCFESGFTDYLTKPVQPKLLIEVLSRYRGY